jgi:hypothetical protein
MKWKDIEVLNKERRFTSLSEGNLMKKLKVIVKRRQSGER